MNWSHMWPERLTVKSARNCLFSLFKQKWIVLMNEESLMNYHMTCQWFFSISSRESFHLSFVWLQLLKNNGRSWWPRQHLTLWPSRGWMCLRWAQEKGRVGWGSPQISKTLPCSCLSPWRWKATFNESTGWHLGTSSVVSRVHTFYGCSTVIGGHIGNSRCPGQGQWVKNLGDVKGEEGWLLEPELWKEQEGTREPHQGHQREPENHHKQRFGAGRATFCQAARPGLPKSSGEPELCVGMAWAEPPWASAQTWPWEGCNRGPYSMLMWTLVVLPFLYQFLSPLSAHPGFAGLVLALTPEVVCDTGWWEHVGLKSKALTETAGEGEFSWMSWEDER